MQASQKTFFRPSLNKLPTLQLRSKNVICVLFSGAPDMKAMDRKDSGISCMSGSPGNVTSYDNMAQSDNFVRQGSGRSSVKSALGMHSLLKSLLSKGLKKFSWMFASYTYYRPQVCEGYVFTGVCLSTGGSPWQRPPPPGTVRSGRYASY